MRLQGGSSGGKRGAFGAIMCLEICLRKALDEI